MARFYPTAPEGAVPRPADAVPDEVQIPELGFTPPDDVPGDLPMIPMIPPDQFADHLPEAGEAAEDALGELDFF